MYYTSVPLVESCTKEELYVMLEELGENTAALRKKNDATFKELEKLYYKRLDTKLEEMRTQSASAA